MDAFTALTALTQLYALDEQPVCACVRKAKADAVCLIARDLYSNRLTALPLGILDAQAALMNLCVNLFPISSWMGRRMTCCIGLLFFVGRNANYNNITTIDPGVFDHTTSLKLL